MLIRKMCIILLERTLHVFSLNFTSRSRMRCCRRAGMLALFVIIKMTISIRPTAFHATAFEMKKFAKKVCVGTSG